ncbi:hypothetical protein BDR07DRAFT_1404641 [Suillus spraguei]|nr:hypothetical protein BDR07DRAFT_1404641 [Suillus spraguei]
MTSRAIPVSFVHHIGVQAILLNLSIPLTCIVGILFSIQLFRDEFLLLFMALSSPGVFYPFRVVHLFPDLPRNRICPCCRHTARLKT